MRAWFAALPIHRKLVAIALAAAAPALILASIGLTTADLYRYRQSTIEDTAALASVIAENTAVAVVFQDHGDAHKTLTALHVRPLIRRACIYQPDGGLFDGYARTPDVACPASPHAPEEWTTVAGTADVVHDGKTIGVVYIERELGNIWWRLAVTGLVDTLMLTLVVLLAFVLAGRLHRSVSEPIQRLAAAAREIQADTVAPSFPVVADDASEIGDLGRALSGMLRRVGEANEQLRRREIEREDLLVREREASRLKDEFLAAVSHELRTPLSAIVGWAQILSITKIDDERVSKGIASIERNARVQARLIDDLVDVSRIVTGKLTLRSAPVDLREVISVAAEAARPPARAKRIELDVVMPATPCLISGDRDRLQQVVSNLLSNAVKFTGTEGHVSVSLTEQGSRFDIVVRDTGVGIKPTFLPFVFDRFRQADGSLTREHGGLGLGLAIVKQITEMHGGAVVASSPGPGQGATFTVRLPALAELADPRPAIDRPAVLSSLMLSGTNILIIDDSADAADVLATALTTAGAMTRVATSGAMGLAEWTRQPADLLLCDLAMPGLDGFEVLRRIREADALAHRYTRAIAVSAHATEEHAARSISAGFDRHIGKPYLIQDLLQTIHSVLLSTAQ